MKKYIIDTNALISFVTDRNPEQQRILSSIFQNVADSKAIIVCHQNVLIEFVYVMDKIYSMPKKHIRDILSDFVEMRGVEMVHEIDFNAIFKIWPDPVADFGDAVIALLGKIKKIPVVTFDRKFAGKLKTLGVGSWP
jgi:predicted nucleic-acid-binding protein